MWFFAFTSGPGNGRLPVPANDMKAIHYEFAYQEAPWAELPEESQRLIEAAEEAAGKAYAPYSGFRVGAAVLLADGQILLGANHENAAYPAGVCAEQAVLSRLDMATQRVRAIAVTYGTERELRHSPLSPCGICRQNILEVQVHQQEPIRVLMSSPERLVRIVEDARQLLPLYFSSENL